MSGMISGWLLAGYLITTLYFLRFWMQQRERLFGLFALAFGILAVQRIALALSSADMEDQTLYYVMRLLAFSVIAYAIIDKNRR